MMRTPFAEILRVAVQSTPGAIGGAFAASDGEMVDSYSVRDAHDWAILTAHYGVLLSHIQAALTTCHHGQANLVMVEHNKLDILVYAVGEGYYALLAVGTPAPLAAAIKALHQAAADLRREMS